MKLLFFICFFLSGLLHSQVIDFTILDATTGKPINNVDVYYTHSLKGTISNDEGRVRISIENDSLNISHIGYQTKKIFIDKSSKIDNLYLSPQKIQLDEVIFYGYDLQKKINYIFDNYKNLYDTNPKTLECTYREKFIRNDTLMRLYQVQLDWWSKIYGLNFKKSLDQNIHIQLKNTDYSKVSDYKDVINSTKGAHLTSDAVFPYLFLNTYLILIRECKDNIHIIKIEKDNDFTKITFDAERRSDDDKLLMKLSNSSIYIDNTTNAIKRIVFNNETTSEKKDLSKQYKIPYTYQNTLFSADINFSPYKEKLLFSSLFIKAKGVLNYQGKTDIIQVEQSFLRTGMNNKPIKKKNRIDLQNPIFDYISPNKQGDVKFLLTEEEIRFINQ